VGDHSQSENRHQSVLGQSHRCAIGSENN
jgi:hypothetical protein